MNATKVKPRGRKRKYAEYEELLQGLPKVMTKRPKYVNAIGVFRGSRGDTAWVKISLPHGGVYKGKNYQPGSSLEIKLGSLSSWSWQQLEDKHRELQGKADRGELLEEKADVLFSDWADEWLSNAKGRLRSYRTVKLHVEKHLRPTFGAKPLGAISVGEINSWISKRLKVAKPATVKRERETLGGILSDAVKGGLIGENPITKANSITGVAGRQRFLDLEEILKLLTACEKEADWLSDLVLWFLHSGMRKTEALGTGWSDIKAFPNGTVIIELTHTKSGGGRQVVCTKTMIEVIERQKVRKKDNDDRLFPYAGITIRRKWQRAREKAGLSDVTMHDLRRTHSTHAAAAGVDLRTLAGRIGHTDLTMLQKHYAAIVGSASAEAADTIEGLFGELAGKRNVEP